MQREAGPTSRAALRRIGVLVGALLACGGGAWVSATPVTFPSGGIEREVLVARFQSRVRQLGYSVARVDYEEGSLRLVALRDDAVMLGMRPVPKSSSWLLVEVGEDHTVTVRAYGDLVREAEGQMHPELRSEMDWLARELESAIRGDPETSEGDPD